MKRTSALLIFLLAALAPFAGAQPAEGIPRTLLPLPLLKAIVNEASGDLAMQNEIALAGVYRNRKAEEYRDGYFEPKFILEKLKEYGLPDSRIIDLPARPRPIWDAEAGELWLVKPDLRKIVDLKEIAASVCPGSASLDVTAELVYVGPGNQDRFYEGKDVKGKIVLVNGGPGGAQRLAVEKYGAAALIGYAGTHPEFDPDEVGWGSVSSAEGMKPTAAFMVSTRWGEDLRDRLERGARLEVRLWTKTQLVPAREQMVEAVIPGAGKPGEELVFTAHLFEGVTKQGANDNISGCVAILETARLLRKLMDDKVIPPLQRTVRFLFIPEIGGTMAYLKGNPDISRRIFANIDEDMVGEDLVKNRSVMELVQSPESIPSYLNDVLRSFFEWMGTTQRNADGPEAYLPVWSPTGTRDPFYWVLDPYSGGSDHVVFIDSLRVPAVMLIVWPDQWYHTSGDTPDKADPTQLKRVAVIGAASAVFLAGAGAAEAEVLLAEVGARALERVGRDTAGADRLVREADAAGLHDAFRDAANLVNQSVLREEAVLESIRFFAPADARLGGLIDSKKAALDAMRLPLGRQVEEAYRARCLRDKVVPQRIAVTAEEIRWGRIVPVPTEKLNGYFDRTEFAQARRAVKDAPAYSLGRAESAVRGLIDGKRSLLHIRDAASAAESRVRGQDVENFVRVLEMTGYVRIIRR